MNPCPRCPASLPNETSLYDHLRTVHRLSDPDIRRMGIGQGWYEPEKRTIMDEDGLRKISPEHRNAWLKSQPKPISVPIVPVKPEFNIQVPQGWKQTSDGYVFEQTIYEHTDPENSIKRVINADLNYRTGKALLYTYRKNTSHIADLVEKKNILLGRLSARIPSDNEYAEIAAEINRCSHEISEAKKCTKTEPPDVETVLEDQCRFEPSTDEQKKWQMDFMEKVVQESTRLSKTNQDHDIGKK